MRTCIYDKVCACVFVCKCCCVLVGLYFLVYMFIHVRWSCMLMGVCWCMNIGAFVLVHACSCVNLMHACVLMHVC